MRIVRVFCIFFLIFFSVKIYGQEILFDLQTLPAKENKAKKAQAQFRAKALLTLPFFDDFSKRFSFPDPSNWSDQYVIVNNTYAINPPTIGVATFDAISKKGELYSFLTTSSLPADTLTSQPINLNLPEKDSLYFSFQYQPKGLGKEPQPTDSLVVEFLSVDDSKWIRVWSASANFANNAVKENFHLKNKIITQKATSIYNKFFKVMLPIADERFRKTGFRFRFMNYASLPTNIQIPSLRGNGDQWHIDLVYLNMQRYLTDTLLNDVAFYQPVKSFLKNYESMPWTHLNTQAKQAELTDPLYFNVQYRNLSEVLWNVTRRFSITNLSDNTNIFTFSDGSSNIAPLSTQTSSRDFEYSFTSSWSDSAKYDFESYLITDIADSTSYLRWNDTIRYTQKFMNYYAYDDGSAENSYGIYGEGSQNGMVAIKYHSYQLDSLKAIKIYFNRTIKDASQFYDPEKTVQFKLTVWKDNNGKPGDTLYQKYGLKPIFRDSLNQFTQYSIERPLKIEGDFWIGWVNTTTDLLNVGFDLNTNHRDKLYYNLTGEWVNSAFEGSLMMRPVFGKLFENSTGVEKPIAPVDFSIYPNPASNQISISYKDSNKPEKIKIVNLAGQVVYSRIYENSTIDIGSIPTGIYLFQVTFHNGASSTNKLVIIK